MVSPEINMTFDLLWEEIGFNDALNKFYLRLSGVRHLVKDRSNRERGQLLHGLLFLSYEPQHSESHIPRLSGSPVMGTLGDTWPRDGYTR